MEGKASSSHPTVTIITPSFNQADFLPATLASIRGQTYPFIEHLVRDGGSTDASRAILAATAPPPAPRLFEWRSEPDGGQAAAVNQAIGASRGEIVGWVNSDDLLAPEAVERAVLHFRTHPDHWMVYGRARWIDAAGAFAGWYPTRPPQPADHFRDGCFICQPTVFLRREAFAAVGLLDTALDAAHDFDFWIRLFKAAPSRIGFVDAEQAQSRLHDASKTVAAFDLAALEAMQVIGRHLGSVPSHWVLSAISQCHDRHPAPAGRSRSLRTSRHLRQALALLGPSGAAEVKHWVRRNRRLSASGPGVVVGIAPDGWAGRHTPIRIRRRGQTHLVLHGRHAHPRGTAEHLSVLGEGRVLARLALPANMPFAWRIPLPEAPPDDALERFDLVAQTAFTPSSVEDGSTDHRELSVLIEKAEIE